MKRILFPVLAAAGLMLLPMFVPSGSILGRVHVASAASGDTLSNEIFQQSNFVVTGGTCQDPSLGNTVISYTATGTAKGPVNGTYTENGTITTGDNMSGTPVNTLSVSGSFTVMGGNGSTAATGNVNGTTATGASGPGIDPNPPAGSTPFGYCTFPQLNVDVFVDYTATVGSTNLSAVAELTVTPVNGSPTAENFQESFLSSSTISCITSIDMPFDGNAIPSGYIWLPTTIQLPGFKTLSAPVTVNFTGQTVSFTANSTAYTFNVPNGSVVYSPTATTATTTYSLTDNSWTTTVPASYAGKTFFSGVEIPVPAGGLPGGIKPVTWSGQIGSSTHGIKVHWQWSGAVYTNLGPNAGVANTDYYTQLGVKPVDDSSLSSYLNSDEAGSPENFKAYVTSGARGGGGGNYTGGHSATGSCTT